MQSPWNRWNKYVIFRQDVQVLQRERGAHASGLSFTDSVQVLQ